jgi:hypothetical protein
MHSIIKDGVDGFDNLLFSRVGVNLVGKQLSRDSVANFVGRVCRLDYLS